ncbi:MAG: glycosyltransferase family 4 protein [Candidatus Omnitrophota bacterium]|jgi:glycosyltransferase involved in cell wall biosynthesis
MKILLLTTHLNPGGVSRYILTLAKGLKQGGHSVCVVCAKDSQWLSRLNDTNILYKVIPIDTKSICSLKIIFSFFKLLPFLRKEKIEILHANTRVTQFLGFLIYKFTGIPYVCTFHGFYRKSSERRLMKFEGVKTIAVSNAVKDHLIHDLKIKGDKINVVHNGVCVEDFTQHKYTKKDYGFKDTDFVVGLLGRISEEKGHFLAASAIKLLSFNHDNVYLAVSGRGKLEEEFKAFIKVADMEEKVKFFEIEAKDFLDIPDILVVPSKREGFGYAIVEAFIKKIPVVGFNTGGIAEIIKDRENGLLFYKYDELYLKQAIEEIMLDKELRSRIIEKALLSFQMFTMEKMALNTERVYEKTLA